MNYIADDQFHLQQSNELFFQISSIFTHPEPHQDQIINTDIIHNQEMFVQPAPSLEICSTTTSLTSTKQQRKHGGRRLPSLETPSKDNLQEGCVDKRRKKIMHREVEKQRRQEMSDLYRSLRSLLPEEHLKGKRSIGDHMNEATIYIRNLENKIKDLSEKRDRLKRVFSLRCDVGFRNSETASSCQLPEFVTVEKCLAGVEVVISCGGLLGFEGSVSLSKVLNVLVEEGLDVVSCISTKLSETTTSHTILSEARTPNSIVNLPDLRQKLRDLTKSPWP